MTYDIPTPIPTKPERFLDQVRAVVRNRNLAYKTELTYLLWIRRFIIFNEKRHPREMAEPEVEAFLKYLAVNRDVSLGTQRVALNAVVFLYRHVLDKPLADLEIAPAKARKHIPTVFSHQEAVNLIRQLDGVYRSLLKISAEYHFHFA